jgi:hypothetical protein
VPLSGPDLEEGSCAFFPLLTAVGPSVPKLAALPPAGGWACRPAHRSRRRTITSPAAPEWAGQAVNLAPAPPGYGFL